MSIWARTGSAEQTCVSQEAKRSNEISWTKSSAKEVLRSLGSNTKGTVTHRKLLL